MIRLVKGEVWTKAILYRKLSIILDGVEKVILLLWFTNEQFQFWGATESNLWDLLIQLEGANILSLGPSKPESDCCDSHPCWTKGNSFSIIIKFCFMQFSPTSQFYQDIAATAPF